MTPQERQLVTDLFDRLATLEDAQRDPEAERAIADGLRQAPNAPYALAQTVLVQDEALKRAEARIRELEAELGIGSEPERQGSFLDNMRDALLGRREPPRAGSVPSVRPGETPMGVPPGFRPGASQPMATDPRAAYGGGGGSFLGTAAAAAAGMIGGSLLLDGIRSMMGGPQSQGGLGGTEQANAASSPWSGDNSGELSRQAGLDDIGRGPAGQDGASEGRGFGLFDTADTELVDSEDVAGLDDGGGFDVGGSDTA
jgi:hypothetical protein